MSNLKQIVKSDLSARNVSPEIINNLDSFIGRSLVRLQRKNVLPPRVWEFTSGDKKQEKRTSDEKFRYNFYYLPDDFRELDEFYIYGVEEENLYFWAERDSQVIQNESEDNLFTIDTVNFSDESKSEDILIAKPFPADDDIIRIKYYVNGRNFDYEWIDERWWEAVIADVKAIIGIGSEQHSDYEAQNVAMSQKRKTSNTSLNKMQRKVKSTFFGNRKKY